MSSALPNGGLFFGAEHLHIARQNRDDEAVRAAVELLNAPMSEPLDAAYLAALRYQFFDDQASASVAAQLLQNANLKTELASEREGCKLLLGWLSVVAMLKRHQSWLTLQAQIKDLYATAIANVRECEDPLDALWQGALQLAVGIVLDQERSLQNGAAVYRKAVQNVIHPEGFLKGIADGDQGPRGYAAQVSGTGALVLMAEMAARSGLDLWSVNNRGVTPVTASTYLLFYYFYPEKWIWSSGITRVETEAIMRRDGAFIEMVNRRHPLRDCEHLLDELRPLFNPLAGGLTTLTHGAAPNEKRRWRLW